MTKEEIIEYFKNNSTEISKEKILHYLFQNGEISFSDFLEIQQFLKENKLIKNTHHENRIRKEIK